MANKGSEGAIAIQDLEANPDDDQSAGAAPEDPFKRLPDELVVTILSHLDLEEVLSSAARTCVRFARLALDPALWTRLEVAAAEEGWWAEKTIRRCFLLQHLTLAKRKDAEHLAKVALETSSTSLDHLEIIYCDPLSPSFFECVGNSASIRKLNLIGNGVGECGDSFSTHAVHLRGLTHLNLFNCRSLTGPGLRGIADHCQNLVYLNTEEVTHLDESSINHLLSRLGPRLLGLFLDGEGIGDGAFANLNKCKKLEVLGVTFAELMGSAGLEAISALSGLTSLKVRRGKELRAEDFVRAFSNHRLPRLVKLDLSECASLDDSGMTAVAENCPLLRELTLNWCWDVGDDGVRAVIRGCPDVEVLELLGLVKLTSAPLEEDLHRRLPLLARLDLEQCPNIDDDGLVDLVARLPRLHLVSYYGEVVALPAAAVDKKLKEEEGGEELENGQ